MKPCVVFGNSPFIDTVDVQNLIDHYVTIGMNEFGGKWPVTYNFLYDSWMPQLPDVISFAPHWMKDKGPRKLYDPKASPRPIYPENLNRDGIPKLGFAYYTPSIAINWAIQNRLGPLFLVGIDHDERAYEFDHWDGYRNERRSELSRKSHQDLKRFVEACQRYAPIFQCNPDVTGWNLPYKDLRELYVTP